MPAINWDGRVLGCSVNRWGDFGVVGRSLAEALGSEKLAYARQMLLGKAAARADIPCTRCHNYSHMERDKSWMSDADVESAKRHARLHELRDAEYGRSHRLGAR
jgi:hypothetical protein